MASFACWARCSPRFGQMLREASCTRKVFTSPCKPIWSLTARVAHYRLIMLLARQQEHVSSPSTSTIALSSQQNVVGPVCSAFTCNQRAPNSRQQKRIRKQHAARICSSTAAYAGTHGGYSCLHAGVSSRAACRAMVQLLSAMASLSRVEAKATLRPCRGPKAKVTESAVCNGLAGSAPA